MSDLRTDQEVMQEFSRRFTSLRQTVDSDKNNKEVGKIFCVSDATISKWGSGLAMPKMANACLIAERYKVSVEWLLTGRGEKHLASEDDSTVALFNQLAEDRQKLVLDLIGSLTPPDPS